MKESPDGLNMDGLRALAEASGLSIPEEDLQEVAFRLKALMIEVKKVEGLDLATRDPNPLFANE